MSTIVTRAGKGSPLTHAEVDANFTNLNTDKYQSGASALFTSVAIDAPTTDATFTNPTNITGWVYSGKSFSVNTQDGTPQGIFFRPNGTEMFVVGSGNDRIYKYTLGTAWDVSTASFSSQSPVITQDATPIDLYISSDGLTVMILGNTNDTVYQYSLSVAWDVTTLTYASKSFSVTTQESTPSGMWFRPDGSTMYIVGTTNDTVYQYALSTAFDIATASYSNISFSVAAQEGGPSQVVLSNDGTKMWVSGSTADKLNEYNLGTAWNVSTATFVNYIYLAFQETNATGLFIDSTAANRVYIVGTTNDTVYQYNTATNTIAATTDRLFVSGEGYVNGNFVTTGNAFFDNGLTVQSTSNLGTTSISATLTASSAVNFSANTANISIGTAQTTGALSLGGTTQTGILTVGQSTGAQTLNIGTGATTSGTTKAVNIGTAGVSGSTTTINIGSAVSGATSTTTLNGLVVDSISAAVSAAGSTQGTATALVSTINNVTVVAAAADGVRLPTAVAGMRILVRNSDSADTLKIYPATGAQINALAANASFSLTAGSTTELFASTTTQWYTF